MPMMSFPPSPIQQWQKLGPQHPGSGQHSPTELQRAAHTLTKLPRVFVEPREHV